MSLAAEDEEESLQFPLHSSRSTRGRGPRQQHFATRPRPNARPAANLTDPFAALHPTMLLGNSHAASHADHDTAYAMMAALMADFVEPSGVSHIGAATDDTFIHLLVGSFVLS